MHECDRGKKDYGFLWLIWFLTPAVVCRLHELLGVVVNFPDTECLTDENQTKRNPLRGGGSCQKEYHEHMSAAEGNCMCEYAHYGATAQRVHANREKLRQA